MQRVLTEFEEVQKLIFDHTGVTIDEYSPFYQCIVSNTNYTSMIFQMVDVQGVGCQDIVHLIVAFNRSFYMQNDLPPFTTDYINDLFKGRDEYGNNYCLYTSKKIFYDSEGNTFYVHIWPFVIDQTNNTITYFYEYNDCSYIYDIDEVGKRAYVYNFHDDTLGDVDFNYTIIDTFTNLVETKDTELAIFSDFNSIFKAKTGINIPTQDAEYESFSMQDKINEYLGYGHGMAMIFTTQLYENDGNIKLYPDYVYLLAPYDRDENLSYDDFYLMQDSDVSIRARKDIRVTSFRFDAYYENYEVYWNDDTLSSEDSASANYYPNYADPNTYNEKTIYVVTGLKELPTMDEAVEMYRDLMTDISDAIKETIGLTPDTIKLETWLYNTPRQYSWANYRGYTYRDDTKEDIVSECIKSLNEYDDNAYACSISIVYYETAGRGSSSISYLDIYINKKETSSSSWVKTYLCRYKLNINATGSVYPKYIGIEEKITENIQDITYYGVSYGGDIYDKRFPSNNLIIPKTTIKPYEFAKTIAGSGEDSNHYNYRWILRDTANAIRSISGSSDVIAALDIPDTIRNLNNRDLITDTNKNLNNWTKVGSDICNITFSNYNNHLTFDNLGGITVSDIINRINNDAGYSNARIADNATNRQKISEILTAWKNAGEKLIAGRFYNINNTRTYCLSFFVSNNNDYSISGTAITITPNCGTFYQKDGYYDNWFSPYIVQNNSTYTSTNTLIDFGKYSDYPSNDNVFSLTIPTDGSNLITFDAKTPTGFNQSSNHISVSYEVGGIATVDNVTLDYQVSSDYTTYSVTTGNVDSDVTISLDLSTIVSANQIELDIKDISMHKVTSI